MTEKRKTLRVFYCHYSCQLPCLHRRLLSKRFRKLFATSTFAFILAPRLSVAVAPSNRFCQAPSHLAHTCTSAHALCLHSPLPHQDLCRSRSLLLSVQPVNTAIPCFAASPFATVPAPKPHLYRLQAIDPTYLLHSVTTASSLTHCFHASAAPCQPCFPPSLHRSNVKTLTATISCHRVIPCYILIIVDLLNATTILLPSTPNPTAPVHNATSHAGPAFLSPQPTASSN